MVRRAKKTKTAKRKVVRKKAVRKTTRKTVKKPAAKKAANPHWAAYKAMQNRVDVAWKKLQANVKRKASLHEIMQAKNDLMLLLGECNYMARECTRLSHRNGSKK